MLTILIYYLARGLIICGWSQMKVGFKHSISKKSPTSYCDKKRYVFKISTSWSTSTAYFIQKSWCSSRWRALNFELHAQVVKELLRLRCVISSRTRQLNAQRLLQIRNHWDSLERWRKVNYKQNSIIKNILKNSNQNLKNPKSTQQ